MPTGVRLGDELHPLLDQSLALFVTRVRFARDNELDGSLDVGEQAQQPRRIRQEQIGSFVAGEAAGEAERQYIRPQYLPGCLACRLEAAVTREFAFETAARVAHEIVALACADMPQILIREAKHILGERRDVAAPTLFASCLRPQRIGPR